MATKKNQKVQDADDSMELEVLERFAAAQEIIDKAFGPTFAKNHEYVFEVYDLLDDMELPASAHASLIEDLKRAKEIAEEMFGTVAPADQPAAEVFGVFERLFIEDDED